METDQWLPGDMGAGKGGPKRGSRGNLGTLMELFGIMIVIVDTFLDIALVKKDRTVHHKSEFYCIQILNKFTHKSHSTQTSALNAEATLHYRSKHTKCFQGSF